MTESEIYVGLTPILRQLLKNPSLVPAADTGPDQVPGWNSLMLVNIIVAVEDSFGIQIGSAELQHLRSVGDFVRVIRSRQLQPAENP
jgi:acyl carrier protein